MIDETRLFIGNGLSKTISIHNHKYFVFDLDETIGSFSDLYLLCKIMNVIRAEMGCTLFQDAIHVIDILLDIYPEFLRPGIIDILYYIYVKKQASVCDGVFIYTNTQCLPEIWTQCIMNYIERKGSMHGLINNIVLAFKIHDRIIEPKRTSQKKIYREFIKCVLLPNHSSLCFVDNAFYKKMQGESVYYIQPPPYFHTLTMSDIIARFLTSSLGVAFAQDVGMAEDILQEKMYRQSILFGRNDTLYFDKNYSAVTERISHIETSRKLMYHIREYLFYSQKKRRTTFNHRKKSANKTRRAVTC